MTIPPEGSFCNRQEKQWNRVGSEKAELLAFSSQAHDVIEEEVLFKFLDRIGRDCSSIFGAKGLDLVVAAAVKRVNVTNGRSSSGLRQGGR